MVDAVSNDVSAIQPEAWSEMVQVPLYKSLVAMEVANVHELNGFDTIHIQRFGDISAKTYTPGTNLSGTNQDWSTDTIVITTYKHASIYIDDARKPTINIDQWRELAGEEAYQIRNKIDQHVFNNITGADGFTYVGVNALTLIGGVKNRPVSASSANIISLFANAKKLLLQANVEQMGDWCAVVSPLVGASIDIKAAQSGFNVADATLRNGYAGNFMGFEVYISNNLPSGGCSTLNPALTATPASATTCRALYFGRKRMIDLYMKAPTLSIRPEAQKIGSNYVTYTVYGSGVTNKNAKRGLNVCTDITYAAGSGG